MFVRAGLEGDRMNALRRCVSAGEPLNPEVTALWQAATGLDIYDGYGQTETVLLCANRTRMACRGSMGRPSPTFYLTAIDETGTSLPTGVAGNVELRTADGMAAARFLVSRGGPVRIEAGLQDGW